MPKPANTAFTVRLPAELYRQLERVRRMMTERARVRFSRNDVVRLCLKDWIDWMEHSVPEKRE